jgi:hypothetical protein
VRLRPHVSYEYYKLILLLELINKPHINIIK